MSTLAEQIPPHAIGPEKSILSSMLKEPGLWLAKALEEGIGPDHFHVPSHGKLFKVLRELHNRGEEIELVSLYTLLNDRGILDRLGGMAAVTDVYTYAPNAAHFNAHLAIVRNKHALRRVIRTCGDTISAAYESPEDSGELLDALDRELKSIRDNSTPAHTGRSKSAVLSACLSHFEARVAGQEQAMGIETSLAEINRRFRGLHPGRTMIISGYPGGGKTTLAGQLAMDGALAGENTLICSLEMTAEDLMNRMIAYAARLPGDAITDPLRYAREVWNAESPTKDTLTKIDTAIKAISWAPFAIEDMTGANVHQIVAAIRRAHRNQPLKIVVVDFAQRIRPAQEMRRETREQQLAHASNTLADLAKELGFCLLLPSQLNKEGAAKHAEAINEDADLHLQIVQDRQGPNPTLAHIGIAVAKDRHHGQFGETLPIVLDGPMLRFIPKPFDWK